MRLTLIFANLLMSTIMPTDAAMLPSAAAAPVRGVAAVAPQHRPAVAALTATAATPSTAAMPATTGDDALALYHKIQNCAEQDTKLGRAVAGAVEVLSQALRLYGDDALVTSFNGGKDAVVVLHLARAVSAGVAAQAAAQAADGHPAPPPPPPPGLRVIYFEQRDEFAEVDAFVHECVARYGLRLVSYDNTPFAEGLQKCIGEHGSRAFVLGTRSTDPNAAGQESFAPSSNWMPPFMRVNPILGWGYAEVWEFLRHFSLPYCSLYEVGYTSLGKRSDTAPNPALLKPDGSYAPAWELSEELLERAGRDAKLKLPLHPAEAAAARGEPIEARTAALLVIGDEILSGKTPEANGYEAARALKACGVTLRRVAVVADRLGEISTELSKMAAEFDIVMTSGGLGPTHDDITVRATAAGLRRPYERNAQMEATIRAKLADTVQDEVVTKMSTLPRGALLRQPPNAEESWPILQCANVFVLPGVPHLFLSKVRDAAPLPPLATPHAAPTSYPHPRPSSRQLGVICEHFLRGAPPAAQRKLLLRVEELSLVTALNEVVAAHQTVHFGSYPRDGSDDGVLTIITLEAPDEAELDAAVDALLATLPPDAVARVSSADEPFDSPPTSPVMQPATKAAPPPAAV